MKLTRAEHNYNRAQKAGRKLAHEAKAIRDLAHYRDMVAKGKWSAITPRSERRKEQLRVAGLQSFRAGR